MKALIAMSGGVDSSVAAYLMKKQGYECIGCTMKLYDNEDACVSSNQTCCSISDIEDARSVCYKLGIPHYVFNFTSDFREKVIQKFVQSYINGETPNPCIDCNRYLKFEKLLERAKILQCDYVVTGHYARVEHDGNKYLLKKAEDLSKDQSYVLYSLTQKQLAYIRFPLGNLKKSRIRQIAEENGFVNANKPESQDICFVPGGDYAGVINKHLGEKPLSGKFISTDGKVLGEHKGIIHYTVGQHRKLGLTLPTAMYVCRINAKDQTIILGKESDLYSSQAQVREFNWISGEVPREPIRCKVKIRYRQPEQWATVTPMDEHSVHIEFDEKQRAITPGQAAVLYDRDTLLGGGVIN
jgi:tRNA-specific 2-thiouridylase